MPDASQRNELPDEEVVHAVRVLRMSVGDEMMLMDGVGSFYKAKVTLSTQKRCFYEIVESMPQERQWLGRIHLAIAPTKLIDRMEWLVEKATEIGIDELTFLNCQFSERQFIKLPRLEKIAVSAVKQSRKAYLPRLNEMVGFRDFISQHREVRRYIAHCYDEVPRQNLFDLLCKGRPSDDTVVMVGPEGDFSIEEVRKAVDAGFLSVDLGTSRLRTETAGLASVMMVHLSK